MTLKVDNLSKVLINNMLNNFNLNKWRKDFITEVFCLIISIKGRINFSQLARYGGYGEQRYRQQFEASFDFFAFNKALAMSSGSKSFAIAFDPSYISKSGKKTPGLDWFWSGCAGKAKWGLEIGGIAAIDLENKTAFHLEAIQTPAGDALDAENLSLLDWYAKLITDRKESLLSISPYLVADAFFSKKPFVDRIIQAEMHLISRLRDDADLRYIYSGAPTGKKGRPKKYNGKIRISQLDYTYFELLNHDGKETFYCATVYSKALKRNIKLVIMETVTDKMKLIRKLYFCTDLLMNGMDIHDHYHNRFQIEFLYRDGKQYTGLTDCQARDTRKLQFHFNSSLTAINIAKVAHWLTEPKETRGAFSMADIKTMYHNTLLLNRFFEVFGISANSIKNHNAIKELINFGKIAA
jgi:hypothetical protein